MSIRRVPSPEVVMGRQIGVFVVWLAVALAAAQQGGFGGGGFGGGQGGFGGGGAGQGQGGGAQGQGQDGNDRQLRGPFPYLNQPEATSILTPGEYVEWELDLKQGQVVIAEARSDAFDPAMEIVEGEKVLIDNDDRYPGDQRPMLLWTCPKDGKYLLRIRSFRGRAGGQVFSRHVELNCQTLKVGLNQLARPEEGPLLLRTTLKAGEVVQPITVDQHQFGVPLRATVISSVGLPCPDLIPSLTDALVGALCAPVDGDYFFFIHSRDAGAYQRDDWQIQLTAVPALTVGSVPTESVQNRVYGALWAIPLKKGEFIQVSSGYGRFGPAVALGIVPDFASYDPKGHPFAPKPSEPRDPEFRLLPMMGFGESTKGIVVQRDCTIWVTQSMNSQPGARKLEVRRASQAISGRSSSGRLQLNAVEYWEFQAAPGDVVKLTTSIKGFASEINVLAPNLQEVAKTQTFKEEDSKQLVFVANQSGRYLIALACQGYGGTGTYELVREIVPAEPMGITQTVEETVALGNVKVYRVTFPAGPTKLLRIAGSPNFQIRSESGGNAHLNSFSIVNTHYYHAYFTKPTSFLIVIDGNGMKFNLSFVDPP